MEYQRDKAIEAQRRIAEISAHSFSSYAVTVEQMYSIKQAGNRPPELQQYIDRAFEQGAHRTLAYNQTASDLGVNNILSVLERPTIQPHMWRYHRFSGKLDDE
jgi:hypothetical protein